MEVYLIRHAKSLHDPKFIRDADRPLSHVGVERQLKASQAMKTLGLEIHEAWVSPFLRAKQTLSIILEVLDQSPVIIEKEELVVFGDPYVIYRELFSEASLHPEKHILVVGHNPSISELYSLLCNEKPVSMKTSDLAHIHITPPPNSTSYLVKYYSRKNLLRL